MNYRIIIRREDNRICGIIADNESVTSYNEEVYYRLDTTLDVDGYMYLVGEGVDISEDRWNGLISDL
jgi:hypothetical protein